MADFLVTGTDTGVGKTVVAAALVMALRQSGVNALGFKPAQTGLASGEEADAEVLAAASSPGSALAAPLLSLEEPLAPAVAAERAGVGLDGAAIEERVNALRRAGYCVVVEGAGGLLVPLTWSYTALDLAARAGLRAIVVARAGLGTLNHVRLTLAALESRAIPVKAIVLNGRGDAPDLAETTNPGALARLAPGIPLVVLPRYAATTSLEAARLAVPALATLLPPS